MDTINKKLQVAGYHPRRPELIAVAGMFSRKNGKARALLIEGPPGCGKTALGEAIAQAYDLPLVVHQFHAWTDDQELFCGIDIASAVAGDADSVRQPGVLARAAELSHHGQVVLVLDEIDKASDRAENLLLDWLQSGRVPVRPGEHTQTNLGNLLVFITSNSTRPIGDALLRRVRRLRMHPLPVSVIRDILSRKTGAPSGIIKIAVKAAFSVAEQDQFSISIQEMENLIHELAIAESLDDVRQSLAGWCSREDAGHHFALSGKCTHDKALWAEVKKWR